VNRLALRLAPFAALVACSENSMLAPQGPGAARLADLSWFLFAITGVPAVVTILFVCWAFLRRPKGEPAAASDEDPREYRVILLLGLAMPAVIVAAIIAATLQVGAEVATSRPPSAPALTIDVTGHQFWWDVFYPDHGVRDANELHIPVGRPVLLRMTAADVIHSLWVPVLHGKTDLIPGHVTNLWLQADRPGAFRGFCAEFCGVQHALMQIIVVAHEPAELEAWLAARGRPVARPETPDEAAGFEVYERVGCATCHAIQGLVAQVGARPAGPDLTHLATRRTLAAGILPNNPGNLGGWVVDPQSHKPGNLMPPSRLESREFHQLLAFLGSLR
jgi:cytochrome c oxidase subunit II